MTISLHRIVLSISVFGALILCCSCKKEVRLTADAVVDRSAMPVLEAHDVTTLISDSGIVRYRIKTPVWQVFDKAQPAYWEFVEGVYLEQFNIDLSVEASLRADYAYYDQEAELWHLTGNVHALNRQGEQFDTPELFWDQRAERIYSDKSITIRRAKSIIEGVGFSGQQDFTKYTILHPTGLIPIEE